MVDAMQEEEQRASELPGDGHHSAQLAWMAERHRTEGYVSRLLPAAAAPSHVVIAIFLMYLAWCDWAWRDPQCLQSGVIASWETDHSLGQLSCRSM